TGTVSHVGLATGRNRPVAVCRSAAHWHLAADTGYAARGSCSENPGRDSVRGATRPPTPTGMVGVTPFAGGRASVVPDPERRHRLRRAGAPDTDRPREAGDGGRRGGSHSAPRAPWETGGDKTGYVATSGPDCGASSRPQGIHGLRPATRLRVRVYQV